MTAQAGVARVLVVEHQATCPLGRLGTRYRGHEHHHAAELDRQGPPLFRAACARGRALGEQGCRSGSVAGSFLHLIDRSDAREARS